MAAAEPRFPVLVLDVSEAQADELGPVLFELGATGVELRDDTTWNKGPGGALVRLVASFELAATARAARDALLDTEPGLSVVFDEIVGDAWRDKYKEYFKPFALTKSLVVAPPWERFEASPAERVLVMDPGRAFGTGLHATTSMVAELCEEHAARLRDARVLDVGTGSGILGLVALMLGADSVVAVDNDPEVIAVALENAERNGFAARMHVSTTELSHVDGGFDVVLANIRSEVLVSMAGLIARRAEPGALVVLSGILASEEDAVMRAYAAEFTAPSVARRAEGDDAWIAIALSRR